ncbi:hypothetical protein HPB47_025714 [Ixodes persulcatus]|uniref:Uncharacterized protein n=1 Tax=Ixodes persulcatus TaxID=34615 RepID=A0AC60Q138_IXOPE|nr:hypothetical protein HPB47_025714 [Ixodes persulcatus]
MAKEWTIRRHLEEQDILTMEWPPKSKDLNPAGHKLDFISCQLGFNLGLVQKILKDHGCKNVSVRTRL